MSDSNPALKNILSNLEQLSLPDLEYVFKQVEKTLVARREEAATLLKRLEVLGVAVAPAAQAAEPLALRNAQRQRPEPKYRSKVDPNLVWTGRGRMAGWLVQEMGETGLPPEAFLINPVK